MKNNFAKNLRYYRKLSGLTQLEISEILGIHRSSYTSYETGKRECSFDLLLEIAEILNVTTDELLKQKSSS